MLAEDIIKQLMMSDTNSMIDVLVDNSAIYACRLISLRNSLYQTPNIRMCFMICVSIRAHMA